MRKPALVGLLLAVLAPVWAGTAQPASAAQSSCDGVWVVVDYGDLGGIDTKCATSYGTGADALRSAGFDPTITDGFVNKISGKPSKPDPNKAYWSYWQASLKTDGSYSGWKYSNLGATASHPQRGNAEGWRYQSLTAGNVPPGAAPPKGEASPPTPKPTAKPTESAKPTPKPSPKPSATTKSPKPTPSASTTKSPTPTNSASASASAPGPTPTPTPAPETSADSPAATPSVPAAVATPYASETIAPAPDPSGSGPLWLVVAAVVLVGGGGGLGLWWYLRGRTR